MFTFPAQLSVTTASIRRRLGDPLPVNEDAAAVSAPPLWTDAEIEGHFRDGLEELCRATGILWDKETLDDIPPACNYNFDFERSYITGHTRRFTEAGGTAINIELHVLGQQYECNFPWEADLGSHSQLSLGEIEFPWERDYAPVGSLHCAAVVPLPDGALQVERVTWDNKRIAPLRSSELERHDSQYETTRGVVQAYSQDKDGLSRLRKYQIPSTPASLLSTIGVVGIPRGVGTTPGGPAATYHMHLDEWGMVFSGVLDSPPSLFGDFIPILEQAVPSKDVTWLRSDSPWAGCEVVGSAGGLRRLPGYHPARATYGTGRHIAPTTRNTAVETQRNPLPCEQGFDRPQVPAFMVLYVRYYTLWKCLSRKGAGQNLKLAAHYKQRWQQGMQLTLDRLAAVQAQVVHGFGPQGSTPNRPPLARPSSDLDYGQMDKL